MQVVCAFTAGGTDSRDKHNKTIRSVPIVVMRGFIPRNVGRPVVQPAHGPELVAQVKYPARTDDNLPRPVVYEG
jgi:hypothetical protein